MLKDDKSCKEVTVMVWQDISTKLIGHVAVSWEGCCISIYPRNKKPFEDLKFSKYLNERLTSGQVDVTLEDVIGDFGSPPKDNIFNFSDLRLTEIESELDDLREVSNWGLLSKSSSVFNPDDDSTHFNSAKLVKSLLEAGGAKFNWVLSISSSVTTRNLMKLLGSQKHTADQDDNVENEKSEPSSFTI